MRQYDIAILTDNRFENPASIDESNEQVILEDEIVQKALEAKGCAVIRVDWARKDFDWSVVKFAIFRSTWNYTERFDEFSQWCEQVKKQLRLINSYEQICWNMDKHYLFELSQKGINIPKSVFIAPQQKITLLELHHTYGWDDMVLKPAISAGGRHTYRINKDNLSSHEKIFQELIINESMMLQPFLNSIQSKGELSLIMIKGQYTHAVLKKSKPGDFRVQDDFGGSVAPYKASTEEIAFAEKVLRACHEVPLYSRVDIVWDNDGGLALSEVELIEPELWFRFNPKAANLLAKEIASLIDAY